ncbi:MAG: tRNA uridine-5-carboxymethylaminomethyl(34) synthesis GTPase MnmE [Gammaproteobacteria bacterium]
MSAATIVAVASPPGRGAIGIVRLSGPTSHAIAARLAGTLPVARYAQLRTFRDEAGEAIDEGLVIVARAPGSYTGEDMVELHCHGNPLLLERLVAAACALGARRARPGEFTERAFRNGRLDLAQVEAVADLIAAASTRAARAALRTLHGEFARAVDTLVARIRTARAALEASIDFADDLHGADLIASAAAENRDIVATLDALIARAHQGARLAGGANIALVGAPNVGKSSLLNRLAGHDRAIVTATPGTTRDVVDVDILIGDLPVRLVDTAGLRASEDAIEREGMRRSHEAATRADLVIVVTAPEVPPPALPSLDVPCIEVRNKLDLSGGAPRVETGPLGAVVHVSALTGAGVDLLVGTIEEALGIAAEDSGDFAARARHVDALREARAELAQIESSALEQAPELAAERYRAASDALERIAGRSDVEYLLGDIFAAFCIGK